MSLLFNTLFRFVIAFPPRSKHILISWLQSPSALILEPKNIKSVTVSIVSPSICMKRWDRMLRCSMDMNEPGQTPGDSEGSEGQGGLVCCSPWGRKESDTA